MRRLGFIIIVCLGITFCSCENNNSKNVKTQTGKKTESIENKSQNAADAMKEVKKDIKVEAKKDNGKDSNSKTSPKRKVVAKPKSSSSEKGNKAITLEEAIKAFDRDVNSAKQCKELMNACQTFDNNVKRIVKNDGSITIASVEQRQDVRAIRKISEDKSLEMCQTQRMVPGQR